MQSWIPTLLSSLGLTQLTSIGILSSLPWLVRRSPCPISPLDCTAFSVARVPHPCLSET
jgi:hypothetical protein